MPPKWVAEIIGAAGMLVGVVLGLFLMRKRLPMAPRQMQRQNRLTLVFSTLAFVAVACVMWRDKGNPAQRKVVVVMSMAVAAMMGAMAVYEWIRTPAAREELGNFAADSRHCGRCGYDLTANVSGICPECGWQIPQGKLDIDSPGWALWWRQWRIDHLRNWRRTFAMLLMFALVFAAIAVVGVVYFKTIAMTLLMAFMAVHMAINAIRVAVYGRRCSGA